LCERCLFSGRAPARASLAMTASSSRSAWADACLHQAPPLHQVWGQNGSPLATALHQVWVHPDLDTSGSNQSQNTKSREDSEGVRLKKENQKDITFIDGTQSNSNSTSSNSKEGGESFSGWTAAEALAWANRQDSSGKLKDAGTKPLAEQVARSAEARAAEVAGLRVAITTKSDTGSADEEGGNAGTWSKGAELHSTGHCRPCHYVNTKKGCSSGADCTHCHLLHPRTHLRPSKSKRAVCKRRAAALDSAYKLNDAHHLNNTVKILSQQGEYMSSVVKSKLRHLEGEVGDDDEPQSSPSTKVSL